MNAPYPIPGLASANPAYFFANNTLNLGSIEKPVNATTFVTIDYSNISGPPSAANPINAYWFVVSPGSAPALNISTVSAQGGTLTFFLSAGVSGVAYELQINMSYGEQVRTDTLTVSVPDAGCGCGGTVPSVVPLPPNQGNYLTGEGTIFVNSEPRFFVNAGSPPQGANIMDQWYNPSNGVVSELATTGMSTFWLQLNPPAPAVEAEVIYSEKLTVTGPDAVSPLTNSPNGNMIEIIINGTTFLPVGLHPPFSLNGNNIVWTSPIYAINPGDEVVAVYTYNLSTAVNIFTEALTIAALNTFPPLTYAASGFVELVVNGRTFVMASPNSPFSVSGKQITWLSTTFSIVPGANVVAVYGYVQ